MLLLFSWLSLLFTNAPEDTVRSSLRDLPWTEKELKAIALSVDADLLLGRDATESAFKADAPKYQILHLATHTLINDEEPLYSKFVFAPESGSAEDGYLHAYELYTMQLHADLAVLSGCNTGSGKLITGEGMMSLARGFLYAGTPSLITTLWPVDDRATSLLMEQFYTNLAAGKTKDEALRTAKLSFLSAENPHYADPYYWSGVILIGNPDALLLQKEKPTVWVPVLMISIILTAVTITIYRFRQSSRLPA